MKKNEGNILKENSVFIVYYNDKKIKVKSKNSQKNNGGMNVNIKKLSLLFLLLTLTISLFYFNSTVYAAEETPASDFDYYVDDETGTVKIERYNGHDMEVVVPAYIEGHPVTIIGDYAFEYNKHIMEIVLPNTIKEIKYAAFTNCTNLMSINLPEGLTTIEEYAFDETILLDSITLPNTLTKLGDYAFRNSGITKVTIPESITVINTGAFSECASLTEVTLPNNLNRIGEYAFSGCSVLQSINIPNSVRLIEDYAFARTAISTISLPNNSYYKSISNNLFNSCDQLKSIIIPEGVTTIGDWAFYYCSSLSEVTIPSTVKIIGEDAFSYCGSLVEITIPEGTTTIKDNAFYDCIRLAKVYLPKSVSIIGKDAFAGSDHLVLYVWENSYAKTYAMQNNLHFELRDAAQDKKIIEVYTLPDVTVPYNTPFSNITNLPTKVTVKLEDNTPIDLNITWLSSNYNQLVSGIYHLEGILELRKGVINPDNKRATINIIVQDGPPVNYHIWSDVRNVSTPNYSWKIKFNKPIDPNTVNSSKVYIKDEQGNVYTNINLTVNSDVITLNNTGAFEKNRLYYLYIEQGIKSLDGKNLQQPIKMPFMYKVVIV